MASARAARALPGIALGIASDHRDAFLPLPLEGAIELRPVGSQCKTLRIKLFFTSGAILLAFSQYSDCRCGRAAGSVALAPGSDGTAAVPAGRQQAGARVTARDGDRLAGRSGNVVGLRRHGGRDVAVAAGKSDGRRELHGLERG